MIKVYEFGYVLQSLKSDDRLKYARQGWWNSEGMYISIQNPDEDSKMTLPYIYMSTVDGIIPWIPTNTDILADDWYLVIY